MAALIYDIKLHYSIRKFGIFNTTGVAMKRSLWMLAMAALLTPLAGEALAQLRLLPASEFQRIAVRIPQAVSRNLEAMQRSNDFEFLAKFRAKSRYRRIFTGSVGSSRRPPRGWTGSVCRNRPFVLISDRHIQIKGSGRNSDCATQARESIPDKEKK